MTNKVTRGRGGSQMQTEAFALQSRLAELTQ
jgi:hypothetical protein